MEKFQDDTVKLEMIKTILDGGYFNDNIYLCKMIKYNEEEECIYLLTGKTELSEFSLDSIYVERYFCFLHLIAICYQKLRRIIFDIVRAFIQMYVELLKT